MLAEIDTPEIDQQLLQARADLATAKANETLARTTAERYQDLIKTDSVSRQDLDNANGSLRGQEGGGALGATPTSSGSRRCEKFKTIHAPFDGVITARNTDIGALIGSGSGARELFHVAAVDRLRVSRQRAGDVRAGRRAGDGGERRAPGAAGPAVSRPHRADRADPSIPRRARCSSRSTSTTSRAS